MKPISFSHLDVTAYTDTLNNGLQIYIIPKENYHNIRATFVTKYGSNQSEFVPLGKTEMKRVPDGVAHFLEHKLFEQEDGSDPFDFFDTRGCECNASTNPWKTSYWFSGTEHFEENLNFLLDFVQQPYFTKKTVEKEKGIIKQEIDMYLDDPYRVGFEKSNWNSFQIHPIRIPVGGTKESVEAITKEDLYTCYQTFYHPSNMIVVITGNIDPEKTIDFIRNNQENKQFEEPKEIEVKKYDEPDSVFLEHEVITMNVTVPKIFINYKINITNLPIQDRRTVLLYLSLFLDLKLGTTSLFSEVLKQEQIVTDDLYYGNTYADKHVLLTIEGETEKIEELIKKIEEELHLNKWNEADFNRKKKTLLSSCIFLSDNVDRMGNKIINDMIFDGDVHYEMYEEYKKLNFEDFKKVMDSISFEHRSVIIIQAKTS